MNNTYNKLLTEEINKNVDRLKVKDPKAIVEVLKELFSMNTDKLIGNISNVEVGSKNTIAQESWDWFLDTLAKSVAEDQDNWLAAIKEVKLKLLTFKYFSRKEMIGVDAIEQYIRREIKPYWAALQSHVDLPDFRNKVFQLPVEMQFALVRFMFAISDELKERVKVTNADLKDNINKILQMRMKIAERIGQVSNGYQSVLSMKDVKELFDNGVIFEDNFINRGICEYIMKLLNHEQANARLKETFSSAMLKDLRKQIETASSYMEHIVSIKNETGREFFSTKGEQIGKRFDNEIEIVKNKDFEGYVVDKHSRLKEPKEKVAKVDLPWEAGGGSPEGGFEGPDGAAGGPGGASSPSDGGGSFGGGGFSGGGGFGGDFGGDFAEPGSEGEIPGLEGEGEDGENPIGAEGDGTPMPSDETGLPTDFGTVEDNGGDLGGDDAEPAETQDDKK